MYYIPIDGVRYSLIEGFLTELPSRCSVLVYKTYKSATTYTQYIKITLTPESDGTAQPVQSQGGLTTQATIFSKL